jgi:Hydantoinase/oxoprolinase N-terminal region
VSRTRRKPWKLLTSQKLIAVDVGGTFTDVAAFDGAAGSFTFGKALSTHGALVEGIQNKKDCTCSYAAYGAIARIHKSGWTSG